MSQSIDEGGSLPRSRLRLSRSQRLKFGILVVAQVPGALSHFFGLPWTGSVVQIVAAVALLPCALGCLMLDLRVVIPIVRGDNPPSRRLVAAVAATLLTTVLIYL